MESLHQKLGPQAMMDDLVYLAAADMLQYYPYEDESQHVETFLILHEEPEVTPEWGGKYLNTEILLLRVLFTKWRAFLILDEELEATPGVGGQIFKCRDTTTEEDKMARGQVVHHKCYAKSSPIGTCLYEVEFPGGEITE